MKWPSWLRRNTGKQDTASWKGNKSSLFSPEFDEGDAKGFWQWFLENEALLASGFKLQLAGDSRNDAHGDALGAALNRFHPGLVFEMGNLKNEKLDFVISADGIFDSFPAVLSLINTSPESGLFQYTAFRQRTTHVSLSMFGEKFQPETTQFLIEPSENYEGKFDLWVFMEPHSLDIKQLRQAAYILLDSTIGEYDMETLIGGFEVVATPPDIEAIPRPLTELPGILDAFQTSRTKN